MFLKGKGSTDIKAYLELNDIPTATGLKKWSALSIVRVLRNPFYAGTIIYRKSYIPDYLEQKPKKNRGEVEQITVEWKHQPIITKDEFKKVQEMLEQHSVIKEGKKGHDCCSPKIIWTKKLICECGSSFNKSTYYKNSERDVWTFCFQCYNQKNNGSVNYRIKKGLDPDNACSTPIVVEWKLKLMANIILDTILDNKDRIMNIASDIIDETIQNDSINQFMDDEIKEYADKISSNNNKLERIVDMYVNELIDKDNYIKRKNDIDKNNAILKEKIEQSQKNKVIPKEELEDKLSHLKKNIIDNLEYDRNNEISDELIETFVEKIKVEKGRFKWKLNYLKDIYVIENNCNNVDNQNAKSNDMYLTSIGITNDDIKKYRKRLQSCGLERAKKLKENIMVDIYI